MSDPESIPPTTPAPLSLDEVMASFAAIARDPEHRDHFKALKALASMKTAETLVPESLSLLDKIHRLAVLAHSMGYDATMRAVRRAYPNQGKSGISRFTRAIAAEDLKVDWTSEDEAALPQTLRALYRQFPEIKRRGQPKGYPMHRGLEAQALWCREQARKILTERRRKEMEVEARARQTEPPLAPGV